MLNNQLTIRQLNNMKEEIESVYFISSRKLDIDSDHRICIIRLKKSDSLKNICEDLDIEWHPEDALRGIKFGRKNGNI